MQADKCISHLDNSSICSDCKIKSLSDWLTHWLTMSPIELSWTAKNDISGTIICLPTSGRVGLSKQLTNHFSACEVTGDYVYVSPDAPDVAVIPPENEYYGMSHTSENWAPKSYKIGYRWEIHTQWDCATACYKAKGCAGWLFHEFSRCKLLDNKNVKYTWSTALTEWYYQLTSGTAGCGGLH